MNTMRWPFNLTFTGTTWNRNSRYSTNMTHSLKDPCHIGTDPDPLICTTDLKDPDPAFFVGGWQDANKNKFFPKFFAYYFWRSFTCTTIDINSKTSQRSQKIAETEVFSYCFVCWWKGPDLDKTSKSHKIVEIETLHTFFLLFDGIIRIWIREAQKHTDPIQRIRIHNIKS